ncbi:TIGR03557 family F420-dependent LLM class oxidoreductase [Dermatobacter hominis]|uniref:TIGR03557 family F420-dependent LLM class oxidoreductase n=1 Tax=Dermatobacter hominis TaxID=2884263 RepID=UPI001D116DD6|nr:TIGR03557 family F420-dependent LLM class oxidoreductase [Dermatobacter hominis]UDY37480.1 TIGR03557 family F420-dependent LLM class oxidoreductase [Dermatobacter hominis]
MTVFGLKLMSELRGPVTLVDQAIAAEARGLEFVSISDHFHPWLPEQHHSPFAWSVLGAIASRTTTIELATGVTCPILRYHPAIVAQAAATVAAMSNRRFTLAVGAGERLNEHVTGGHFPSVDLRHEMLEEAVDIIRTLWTGDWTTIRGQHLSVEDARLFDLPDDPPDLAVAVSGPASLEVARRCGADAIVATESKAELVDGWVEGGGDRSMTWTEVPFAWAPSVDEGRELARSRFRFGAGGWKVMSELPNPVNFDAATSQVRPEDLVDSVPSGPDPAPYVAALRAYQDAGFERIAIVPVGDDLDVLLEFWEREVRPEVG